jgi:hypothetical protein
MALSWTFQKRNLIGGVIASVFRLCRALKASALPPGQGYLPLRPAKD